MKWRSTVMNFWYTVWMWKEKSSGVEGELVELLGRWEGIPVTYAGGIGSMEELEKFKNLGHGKLDFTIGSALDLFGGTIPYKICSVCK